MTPEDLDRILGSDERIVPSSGFAASVMERAREEAAAPPLLPFPWRRFVLGLLVTVALSGVCGWAVARLNGIEAMRTAVGGALAAFADPRLARPLAGAAAAIAGTYLLVRLTLGFAGSRR
ncbi:MAG TPA: hypothetical protein VGG20_03135 [Thermoanaerobaculia bacterium]|jgi:hypothetical protein